MPAIWAAFARPAQRPVRERHRGQEGRHEGDGAEQERCFPLAPELGDVDLRAGQEREHDAGEGADEGEPVRDPGVEGVPDNDAEGELDQGDGDADFHRDRRGGQDRRRENDCNREFAHLYLLRETLQLG
jgi:hypothetical protein